MRKRFILITLFLLFGFLPTLALLVWGGFRQSGWYTHFYNSWASNALEIPVEAAAVTHSTPSHSQLTGVTLFLPVPSADGKPRKLAAAPWIDWLDYEIYRDGKVVKLTKWTLPELTIDSDSLETLWNLHAKAVSTPDFWRSRELALLVEGPVHVGFAENSLELHQAEMRITWVKNGPQTDIVFWVPEQEKRAGAELLHEAQLTLSLKPVPQNASRLMQAALTTDSGGISVQYLKPLFPMLEQLGPQCRFTGAIAIQQSFSRWSGYFRGTFESVDVSTFFSARDLTGTGTLTVDKARFDGARLVFAEGKFRAAEGTVQRSFLDRILPATKLAIRFDFQDKIPYREIAFRFQVRDTQMQIYGECANAGAGVFMMGAAGPILSEPSFPREPFSRAVFLETLQK